MANFTWDEIRAFNATNPIPLLDGVRINSVADYKWMVILGGFLAFAMAWGIGANDVANAFATSVGAGSLTLRSACVIAAIFEFLGALLMGDNVTDTVRKKVIAETVFDPVRGGAQNGPEILMTGFLVALISATTWLILATYLSLPVSTTHSIIGSLIGVGLAYRGKNAVNWISSGTGLAKLKGVVGVILSWIISPVLSGILGIMVFLLVRHTVLRSKNPVRNGFIFLPFFIALTLAIVLFFIIYKGSPKFDLDEKFSVGVAVAIALGSGAGAALLSWWFIIPQAKRWVDRWEDRELHKLKNPEDIPATSTSDKVNSALGKVGINLELEEELSDDVVRMHDNVEKFDPKAEQLFTWLQVFTAAFDAFAHGANDVANSIGPFASIYSLHQSRGEISQVLNDSKFEKAGTYTGGDRNTQAFSKDQLIPDGSSYCGSDPANPANSAAVPTKYFRCQPVFPYTTTGAATGSVSKPFDLYDENGKLTNTSITCHSNCSPGAFAVYEKKKQEAPLWILALGGVGIVLGLAMWGYRIIVAIGVKLTKLTPSRGFSIEIGAAITVIIASRLGLPVSTTHCQVGATMGVGLVEFKGNTVNWKQFLFICIGWVFTVVFTGGMAAAIFAILVNTPQEFATSQSYLPTHCPGQNMFVYDPTGKGMRGVGCSGVKI